jgi:translation initiation factor IF-2
VVPSQPRLTSPPPQCCGRERSPRSPPFPPPPSSPHPGEGCYNLWLQLYTSEKKKFAECPTPKKKKKKIRNRAKKTCEWAWRMGLLKLRRSRGSPSHSAKPLGEEPRPAGPAPSPMDLRAGRSQASEAPAPAPAPQPRDPVPVLPPPWEPHAGARPGSRARAGGGTAGRPREGPGGDAAFLESARRGQEVASSAAGSLDGPQTCEAATWSPQRGGVPGIPPTESPAQKSGRASPRRGARLRGGGTRREGRRGPGRGRGRERGRGGARGRAGGRRGEADTSGSAALPSRPAGRGRREGGGGRARRAERRAEGRASLAGLGWAGPGRAGPGRAGRGTRSLLAVRSAAGALLAAHGPGAGGR